jgi:hypothetical protein
MAVWNVEKTMALLFNFNFNYQKVKRKKQKAKSKKDIESQVSQTNYLVFAGHGFDAGDLPPLRIFPSSRSDVDHRVVLQLVGAVEDAATIIRPDDRELSVLKNN